MKEKNDKDQHSHEKLLITRSCVALLVSFFCSVHITHWLWQSYKPWLILLLIVAPIIGTLLQKETIKLLLIWETVVIGICALGWMFSDLLVMIAMTFSLFYPFMTGVVRSDRLYRQKRADRQLTLENCQNDSEMCALLKTYNGHSVCINHAFKSQIIFDCFEAKVFIPPKKATRDSEDGDAEWYEVAECYREIIGSLSQKLS